MQGQYYYNPFENNSAYSAAVQRDMQREVFVQKQKKELRGISFFLGAAIILYLVVQLIVSAVLQSNSQVYALYSSDPVFNYGVMILFVSIASVALPFGLVALFNRKKYRHPIIPLKPLKFGELAVWVCLGMGGCTVANVATSYLVAVLKTVGVTLTQGDSLAPNSVLACVVEFAAVAVIPAICEEFAMRCCSLQLLRNYGKGFAVVCVSIVFGLLHGNVIQFIFAFLVGLILAYITMKTDSVIPAMLVHGLNNGISAISDIVEYASGTNDKLVSYLFAFWFAVGVIALIYLALKRKLKLQRENDGCVLTLGEKVSAFIPGMIIPFVILIIMTATTVKIG